MCDQDCIKVVKGRGKYYGVDGENLTLTVVLLTRDKEKLNCLIVRTRSNGFYSIRTYFAMVGMLCWELELLTTCLILCSLCQIMLILTVASLRWRPIKQCISSDV